MVYIVMGVSGSGKSTIGQMLAIELDLPFYDADDFHPEENIRKMTAGTALTDQDRKPWLHLLKEQIEKWNADQGAVLACSALKKSYRDLLKGNKQDNICWIYLKGTKDIILQRMQMRTHYMPPSLLDSQFNALEEPGDAITVLISNSPEELVKQILMKL